MGIVAKQTGGIKSLWHVSIDRGRQPMVTTDCKNDRCGETIKYAIETMHVPKYCSFECRDEAEKGETTCPSCGMSFYGWSGIRCRECSMGVR